MNDIRRTILWVIFGFSMVLLWDQWQVYNGKPATFLPSMGKPAALSSAPAASQAPGPAHDSAVPAPSIAGTPSVPATVAATPSSPVATPSEKIVVNTDVLKVTFDTEGGSIVGTEFVKLADKSDKTRDVMLLDETGQRFYVAQSGLIGTSAGIVFPNHKTPMSVSGARDLKEGENDLVITFTSPDVGGTKLVKRYTLHRGSYAMTVSHAVTNDGTVPVSPQLYLQLVRDGNKPTGESSFYSTFTGPE